MLAFGAVLDSPLLEHLAGKQQCQESVLGQLVITELAAETLQVGILIRLALLDERQLHEALEFPDIEYLALELRPPVEHQSAIVLCAGSADAMFIWVPLAGRLPWAVDS